MAFPCLTLLFTLCVAMIRLTDAIRGNSLLQTKSSKGPSFDAPGLSPQQFLIISSPSEKKVVWTTLKNFESEDGRAFALVDSGLLEPKGMAFDHKNGHLYIADSGAKKIFRYTVLADVSGATPTLTTSGVRLTICEGHPVEWVTVDEDGNLFYTAPDTNNINKIEAGVMALIAKGTIVPSALQIISEKTIEAEMVTAAALAKKEARSGDGLPRDEEQPLPHILSMYEAKLNPHVSKPAAIWADGADLYWTNTEDGTTAGTVVKGQVRPKSVQAKNGPAPFPAESITNMSSGAWGLAKSSKAMFFTRPGNKKGTGLVTGLLLGTDIALDFVKSISTPRGLVWDQDQTMFVADEDAGKVWSFPVGRMMANVPITSAVEMNGAYGLVILSTSDPAFKGNQVEGLDMVSNIRDLKAKAIAAGAEKMQATMSATMSRTSLLGVVEPPNLSLPPKILKSSSKKMSGFWVMFPGLLGVMTLGLALLA